MADRELNIKVKATGTDKTGRDIKNVGKAGKTAGDQMAEGQKRAAKETEKTQQKTSRLSRVLGDAKTQILSFVGAYAGLGAVSKVLDVITAKLERMSQLIRSAYQDSLSMFESAQQLEQQTGTVGKQKFWSQQISAVRRAGRLPGNEQALQILTSLDIAYGLQGGQNQKALGFARKIAPLVGASGMTQGELSSFMKLAQTAGVDMTEQDYYKFYAQLKTGFTRSKSDVFGQYVTGLQQGITGHLAAGGSFADSLAFYNATLAATGNESLAATSTQQTVRVASGAYQKPKGYISRTVGRPFDQLSQDERLAGLLEYARSLPPQRRIESLVKAGIPAETATNIANAVSTSGVSVMESTTGALAGATAQSTADFVSAYSQSFLARERGVQARDAARRLKTGTKFAGWEATRGEYVSRVNDSIANARDVGIVPDEYEPYVLLMQDTANSIQQYLNRSDRSVLGERYDKLKWLMTQMQFLAAEHTGPMAFVSQDMPLMGKYNKASLEERSREYYRDFMQEMRPVNFNQNTIFQIGTQGDPYALPPGSMKPDSNTEF